MKFQESDYDWSDYHTGLIAKRRRRYNRMRAMILEELIPIMHQHARVGNLAINASLPIGQFAVGVRGDARIYAQIVMLTYDRFPGYKRIREISTAITNALPVSRVLYNLTMKIVCVGDTQFLVPRVYKRTKK